MDILIPLIEKSMRVKGYSRIEATERAKKWLAGELGVDSLDNLDFIQEWEAAAIVERTMLPPAKHFKKKIHIPENVLRFVADEEPLGSAYWDELKALWGEKLFNAYFGEAGAREDKGLLSPGQCAQQDWDGQDLTLAC